MTDDRKSLDDFRNEVKTYADRYNLCGYETDKEPYDLIADWSADNYWPNTDKQGVYAIFCVDNKLLYVGKASLSNSIGRRLSTYFMNNDEAEGATSKLGQSWSRDPRYILTVRVKNAWEAPSLEEYLINRLRPIDNTRK